MPAKDLLIPECNFQGKSFQPSWPDDRLLSSGAAYCSNAIDGCEGRSVNNSFLNYQSPNIFHPSPQEASPLHSRHGEEINSNHLLMSPTTALSFTEEDHRSCRMDKVASIDRNLKDCSMTNSSVSLHSLTSSSNTQQQHSQYFNESYYESPTMAMIDSINNSNCYTTAQHHQQLHLPAPQHTTYDDLGDRNTLQHHNMFDATNNENYNPMQPLHFPSAAPSSDVAPSCAEDTLSSSTVAVYHFNNALIDFTNPSDIFQFDRVYSPSNDANGATDSSMCSYQQHPQQQSNSPSSNQGILNIELCMF